MRSDSLFGDKMDFFAAHTYDYTILFGLLFFPRITMLFIGGPFAVIHWVGWFFLPHVTVAVLAYITYADTNPALVAVAIIQAVLGTLGEVRTSTRRRSSKEEE